MVSQKSISLPQKEMVKKKTPRNQQNIIYFLFSFFFFFQSNGKPIAKQSYKATKPKRLDKIEKVKKEAN